MGYDEAEASGERGAGRRPRGGGARERASLGQAPRTCRTRPRGAHTCAARSAPRTCPQKMRLSAAGGSESCDSEEPRENVINAKRRLHWMV